MNPSSRPLFSTLSGIEPKVCATAADVSRREEKDEERPGEYPYTRGIHKDMYRGKP